MKTLAALLGLLAFPALARAQFVEIQKPLAAGPATNTHNFTSPLPGASGTVPQTFIAILPLQPDTSMAPTAATYSVSVDAVTYVPLPAPMAAAVPLGSPQVATLSQPSAPVNGRVMIQINHTPALTTGTPQFLSLKIDTLAGAPATCFFGVLAHSSANAERAKFSVVVEADFYSDNNCSIPPALSAATVSYGKASFNAARTRTVRVFNSGTGNLTLGSASLTLNPTSFYSISSAPASGTVVAPNAAENILVAYTPLNPPAPPAAPHTGTLSVPSVGGPPAAAVALTGEAAFRELVLCIDASNSMNWANDGTPLAACPPATTMAPTFDPDSRIRKVRAALQTFQGRLDVYGDGQTHLAFVRFPGADLACGSSHADALASAPSTWVTTGPAVALYSSASSPPPGAWTPATFGSEINGVTNAGFYHSTPMKAGLTESLARFTSGTGPFRAIVLLSDGFHNVPAAESPLDVLSSITAKPARVYPVGFGTSGSVDHVLLNDLASMSGGAFFDATAAGDLNSYYSKIFTDFMELDTAVDPQAEVTLGTTNVHAALVTEHDLLTTFSVAWNTPVADLLSFELVAPDGRRIKPQTNELRYQEGPKHKMYSLDLRSRRREARWIGEWKLEVGYKRTGPPPSSPPKETYTYDVVMRSDLELRVAFDKPSYSTGDRVVVTARLQEQGRPMRGQAVLLQVRKPSDGMGDWYASHKVQRSLIEAAVASKFGPAAEARIEQIPALFKKHYYLTKILNLAPPPYNPAYPGAGLPMRDDGQGGDLRANDGVYTAALEGLLGEAGNYSFFVTATGKTSGQNGYRREFEAHRHVETRVELLLETTAVRLEPIPGGDGRRRFRAVVTPKDRFGNLLGPGYGREISIRSSLGRALSAEPEDDLEGNYVREFEVDAAAPAPVVEFLVRGRKLPEQLAPGGKGVGGSTSPSILLVGILILLILILLLLLRRA
jgi:hypothetical protein